MLPSSHWSARHSKDSSTSLPPMPMRICTTSTQPLCPLSENEYTLCETRTIHAWILSQNGHTYKNMAPHLSTSRHLTSDTTPSGMKAITKKFGKKKFARNSGVGFATYVELSTMREFNDRVTLNRVRLTSNSQQCENLIGLCGVMVLGAC